MTYLIQDWMRLGAMNQERKTQRFAQDKDGKSAKANLCPPQIFGKFPETTTLAPIPLSDFAASVFGFRIPSPPSDNL
jgi:hypothetical protein